MLHIGFTEVNGKFVVTVFDRFSKHGWFVLLTSTDVRFVAELYSIR